MSGHVSSVFQFWKHIPISPYRVTKVHNHKWNWFNFIAIKFVALLWTSLPIILLEFNKPFFKANITCQTGSKALLIVKGNVQ